MTYQIFIRPRNQLMMWVGSKPKVLPPRVRVWGWGGPVPRLVGFSSGAVGAVSTVNCDLHKFVFYLHVTYSTWLVYLP